MLPAAICIVYILLRVWHITDACLWFDEIFSVHAAEMAWRDMFWFVAQDLIHPPLFYIFLKIWILVGGSSLVWLRYFPVLFSTAALIPFYFLCRQLKLSKPLIALALTFFAVSGSLIKYAQEVRMYSVLLCLSLFSLWLFARYLNVGKGIWILTIINILLVHTQYFGWFLVVAEVAVLIYLQRVKIGQMLIMFGITLISIIPWMIAVINASRINSDVSQNLSWAAKPDLLSFFQFILNLNEPFYYRSLSSDPISILPIGLPVLLILITAAAFYFVDWKSRGEKERNAIAFLVIVVLLPVILSFAASWILPFSIWGTRHFIIIFAPYFILIAKILGGIQLRALRIGFVTSMLIAICAAFYLSVNREAKTPIWCAWENLANSLYDSTLHGTEATEIAVYTFEDLVAYHFWFALRDSDRGFRIKKISDLSEMKEDKAYFIPRGFDGVKTVNFEEIKERKIFIAFRDAALDEQKSPLKELIAKGYTPKKPVVFEADGMKAFLVELDK